MHIEIKIAYYAFHSASVPLAVDRLHYTKKKKYCFIIVNSFGLDTDYERRVVIVPILVATLLMMNRKLVIRRYRSYLNKDFKLYADTFIAATASWFNSRSDCGRLKIDEIAPS